MTCIAVLDISGGALAAARSRLGARAATVNWIESDVTGDWTVPPVDIWHDRALFHFLTEPSDRFRYLDKLRSGVRSGGSVVIATFAPDGPSMCSGLPVSRYSPETLAQELGDPFRLDEAVRETHTTPSGRTQQFWYSRFTRIA